MKVYVLLDLAKVGYRLKDGWNHLIEVLGFFDALNVAEDVLTEWGDFQDMVDVIDDYWLGLRSFVVEGIELFDFFLLNGSLGWDFLHYRCP